MSIESFIFSSISFLSKKERAFALSFIRKLFFYYLEILRFNTTAPDKTSTPENTRPVATTSPVLGRSDLRPPPFSGVLVSSLLFVGVSGVVVVVDLRGKVPSPPPGNGVSGVVVVVVSSPCPSPP